MSRAGLICCPPPPFISAFPPFISAFHLPPEHLVLVVVATPQSAPACCHGTHSILGCPSPISSPCSSCHGCALLADPSCVLGMPWVQAPSPNRGGLAGPGAGRRPCHRHPLCLPWSCSCTMAIGEELHSGRFWREVLAEAVATLIFTGVVLGASAAPSPLVPALAGGLAAATLSCTLGAPQTNPALTLALLCTHKLGALRGAAALLAQCAGAVLAATAARLALPDDSAMVSRVSAAGTAGQALCWETFATFQLALTVFASTDHAAAPTGLALGCAIVAGALAAGPFSGGSMNPARSLGPAVVTGIWDNHWVYWLGPVLGAVLAGLCYEFIFSPGASREKLCACLTCRDVALVETTSPSPSSPSTAPLSAARTPPASQGQGTA
ncbi:aquaporin-2-like isoform X4 [Tympanuchus pallidicinctus]|uniref:aquaporin-2-like isoform X4 n=1 Tax=Tympanuchus pallidicinctus TaxID=109042 RepID=UPI002286E173|nr:aquaporin-2-like isoform X4 [Tympanuchus pallidicinctus]